MTTPALLCLMILVWSGAYAALLHGGSLAHLTASEYGRVLGFKLLAVLVSLGAAGWLRLRLYRRWPPRPALRLELAGLLVTLAVSAWLGQLNPH
ncbi:CopD family protein [Deinococcus lacus]|uniref:CopD family protein n=1 Tax=Deinococcus lacus TaxID=392561 RepID=A0ABW1YAF8_9DEIO